MPDINEQIEKIKKEIRETPHHKGTEHHTGRLRAKLARLKDRQIESSSKKKGGGGGYAVKKQGDATVVLVGPPSVGKSTLLNSLTSAKSKIAPYEFTTVSVIPGMLEYKDAKIQILDVPGLIKGAEEGKGRGKEVLSVVRAADLLIIMADINNINTIKSVKKALAKNGIRVNLIPPDVGIKKKVSGGLTIHSNIKQNADTKTIKKIAREFGLTNAEITIREKLTIERLIDAFSSNRIYIPAIYVVNKTDLNKKTKTKKDFVFISAQKKKGLEKLKAKIWEKLHLVRLYLVGTDEKPNKNHPIVVKKDTTLSKVAQIVGTDFAEDKKKAKIWGAGSKYPGQEVSLKTKVKDAMQVSFI